MPEQSLPSKYFCIIVLNDCILKQQFFFNSVAETVFHAKSYSTEAIKHNQIQMINVHASENTQKHVHLFQSHVFLCLVSFCSSVKISPPLKNSDSKGPGKHTSVPGHNKVHSKQHSLMFVLNTTVSYTI